MVGSLYQEHYWAGLNAITELSNCHRSVGKPLNAIEGRREMGVGLRVEFSPENCQPAAELLRATDPGQMRHCGALSPPN